MSNTSNKRRWRAALKASGQFAEPAEPKPNPKEVKKRIRVGGSPPPTQDELRASHRLVSLTQLKDEVFDFKAVLAALFEMKMEVEAFREDIHRAGLDALRREGAKEAAHHLEMAKEIADAKHAPAATNSPEVMEQMLRKALEPDVKPKRGSRKKVKK